MPPIINDYAIIVDLHRLNVRSSTINPIQGPPPVDLVTITYAVAKPSYTAGEFSLERVSSCDSAYHLRYDISYLNHPLGFILTDRTKKYGYEQHLRSLHVKNVAFYTITDYGRVLAEFLRVFGLQVANTTQLDLSLLTQQRDPAKVVDYYTSKPDKYQRIKRKNDKKPSVDGEKDETTGKVLYTTYWGKGSQTVTLKAYDKSASLLNKPKVYVQDWFAIHGFDPGKPVYNWEISIKSRALKEYRGFAVTEDGEEISVYRAANNNAVSKASKQTEITSYDIELEQLSSPAYLAQLYKHFWPIDIRRKDASRPTNCTRVPLIDFGVHGEEILNKTVTVRPTALTATKSKNTMKNLVDLYRQTDNHAFLVAAEALAIREQLNAALDKMLSKCASVQTTHPKVAA